VVIVDGYVDEPTCLGVPPYISTYPRYIAGAIWTHSPKTEIIYQTIDQVRDNREGALKVWQSSDMLMLIAGMIVPGKYVGGTPISVNESKKFFSDLRLIDIPKFLVGPWAKFGCGLQGGKLALSSDVLSPPFDFIITGDPEIVMADIAQNDWDFDSVDLGHTEKSREIEEFGIRGAKILHQHPFYSRGYLICEIETYRGCPRYLTGGCSFCVEPLFGAPIQREMIDIVKEIESLYNHGVRAFRIGKQADLFTYGSKEMGEIEFPKPNPVAIEELFSKIRAVTPEINVLHIDNVNPGTVARHPEESKQVAKSIIKYHTAGDVAAFGVESLDPEVIKRNNLKATAEEVLSAIRILNEVGGSRNDFGLPHLLPGLNLLYGLPGETKKTVDYNMGFLQELINEGLIVRRINIRQVIGFEGTRLSGATRSKMKRHQFFKHKEAVRDQIDRVMIKRVAPAGTIIRSTFLELQKGNSYLLRQLGTYPLLCHMPMGKVTPDISDVFVIDHGPRSLTVLPYPFQPKDASLAQWKSIPGIGAKRAARLKGEKHPQSIEDIESRIETDLPEWLKRSIKIKPD